MPTVLLVDDHPLILRGLRTVLEAEPDIRVLDEMHDGLHVPEAVARLRPDVLVLDLMIPGLPGLEVTRRVSQQTPSTRVIILSMHANEPYVLEALRHGAVGYVLKDSSATDLVHAVREVIAGRRYLSPALSQRAIETYVQRAQAATLDSYETLTAREREVLQLAAEGCSNPAIAERLGISPRTAETHRANLMRKLALRTQTDLIRYAMQHGLLPPGG
jgi:DNA-binding NarL/FixJ family response regulator